MWEGFLLLDMAYTAARIIEIAEETTAPPSGFRPELKAFLLKVATARGNPGVVSPKRLGKWLRKIADVSSTCRLKNAASYTGKTGRTSRHFA